MKKSKKHIAILSGFGFLLLLVVAITFLINTPKIEKMYLQHENKKLETEIHATAEQIAETREELEKRDKQNAALIKENEDIFVIDHTYPERTGHKAINVD